MKDENVILNKLNELLKASNRKECIRAAFELHNLFESIPEENRETYRERFEEVRDKLKEKFDKQK